MLNNATDKEKESVDLGELWNVVPKNLTEAIDLLDRTLPVSAKIELRTRAPGVFHHGFGRELRNRWKLWEENSPLVLWFKSNEIFHPDDMSGIILNSFHKHLQGRPIDLDGQIEHYKEYWSHVPADAVANINNDIAAVKLQLIEELNNTNLQLQSAIENKVRGSYKTSNEVYEHAHSHTVALELEVSRLRSQIYTLQNDKGDLLGKLIKLGRMLDKAHKELNKRKAH